MVLKKLKIKIPCFNYLEIIKQINTNPEYSKYEAQSLIEKNWINIIKNNYKNPDVLSQQSNKQKLSYVIKKVERRLMDLNYRIKQRFKLNNQISYIKHNDFNRLEFYF